ncbi:hypothetical protein HAX54_013986, partial [Datura stramonium]|nr:hypothetical protein [Datura stramonium]
GSLDFLETGILPDYVHCSRVLSATVDPLQQYYFCCSESAAARLAKHKFYLQLTQVNPIPPVLSRIFSNPP